VEQQPLRPNPPSLTSSSTLRETYTNEYYLTDCGGFEAYRRSGGRLLVDERLVAVADIASLKPSGRVLDLGCGRGELTYYFASLGHSVTSIDYSRDAIELAHETFRDNPELKSRVDLICDDVCSIRLTGYYDLAIASDVIEHLNPAELDCLYREVAEHLSPTGIFVVHTYPNLWFFHYDYPRKRRLAAERGEFLPEEPRTKFELLMHINEQNPRVLRRQLNQYFPNVVLWFGEPSDMGGSLLRSFSHRELAGARDLFAIASPSLVDLDQLICRFQTRTLQPVLLRDLRLSGAASQLVVSTGVEFEVEVELENKTPMPIGSVMPYPVLISYHWLQPDGYVVVHDGIRTAIKPLLAPGHRRPFSVRIVAPDQPGSYVLRITLVQEGMQWFDQPEIGLYHDCLVTVSDPTAKKAAAIPNGGLTDAMGRETQKLLATTGMLNAMRTPAGEFRPVGLICETVNICNSDCIFCPYSLQTRKFGTMTPELFEEVCRQYASMGGGPMSLTPVVGDVLLDKQLPNRIITLQKFWPTIQPSVTTNLYALDRFSDEVVSELLETLVRVHVSVYGLNEEENSAITQRSNFKKFAPNAQRLAELWERGSRRCSVWVSFRNLHEHPTELLRQYVVDSFGRDWFSGATTRYSNWGGRMTRPLPGDAQWVAYRENQKTCLLLAVDLQVYWDGRVSACACCDYDAGKDLALGNVQEQSLAEIYNSAANRQIWADQESGKMQSICKHCTFHQPLVQLTERVPVGQGWFDFNGG
jgi:radical SAM protein with 4Fe4S-binding SPASM domain